MEKKEVIKHSSSIQIENKINLLQRKAWNVLLANAYDELLSKDIYEVNIKELMDIINYESKYDKYLKEILEALVDCKIKWNVLDKDGDHDWGVSTLLAHVNIKNWVLKYSYSPWLRERLYNPAMYARISLSIQNRFKSKHSLALYELMVDYFIRKQGKGETPWIAIDAYRKLMGIGDTEYLEFKKLNKWIIKDPIEEINAKSDLFVEVAYKKEQRKIIAIKFLIKPNPNKNELLTKVTKLADVQAKTMITLPLPERQPTPLYDRLTRYFLLSPGQAHEVMEKFDAAYLDTTLNCIEELRSKGETIKNLGAYTYKALIEGYQFGESQFELDKREAQRKQNERAKQLEQLRAEHARRLNEKLAKLQDNFTDEEMAGLKAEFEENYITNALIRSRWEKDGLDNPMVSALFQKMLLDKFFQPEDYNFDLWLQAKPLSTS